MLLLSQNKQQFKNCLTHFILVTWEIWRERNAKCFTGIERPVQVILQRITKYNMFFKFKINKNNILIIDIFHNTSLPKIIQRFQNVSVLFFFFENSDLGVIPF
jgi:hypothetical protein